MTRKELGSLILKCFGIWCLLQSLQYLSLVFAIIWSPSVWTSQNGQGLPMVFGQMSPVVIYPVAGFLLIAFSDRWSFYLLGDRPEDPLNGTLSAGTAMQMILVGLGLWLIVVSLSQIASNLAQVLYYVSNSTGGGLAGSQLVSLVLRPGIQLLAGLILFFKGAPLGEWLSRARGWTKSQ